MATTSSATRPSLDDLDNYNVDFGEDDPFRSPSPQPKSQQPQDSSSKKRKSDGLGIDEEVDVTKRARVPRVKLDETKLLSEDGIPKLRKRARDLRFKGKGHEFSDAARLLSFYQFWLDDLFPKAKFLDALAMVEKAGHKRALASQRVEWINETKPKSSVLADDNDNDGEGEGAGAGVPNGTTTGPGGEAQATPERTPATGASNNKNDDVPDDEEDLFGATPIKPKPQGSTNTIADAGGAPDDGEEDLDALTAEAEMDSQRHEVERSGAGRPEQTQNGTDKDAGNDDDGMDDLDALMAEAEAESANNSSGKGTSREEQNGGGGDEYADEEAAMAEMGGLW